MKYLITILFLILFVFAQAQVLGPIVIAAAPGAATISVVEYVCRGAGGGGCSYSGSETTTSTLTITSTSLHDAIYLCALGGLDGSTVGTASDASNGTYTSSTVSVTGISSHFDYHCAYVLDSAAGVTSVIWNWGGTDTGGNGGTVL